jgi:23S rRNA pseudouridine1911/1915/1917 synthase
LLDWLRGRFPSAKNQTFKRMLQARRVTVNDVPARALKQPLSPADRVEVSDRARDRARPGPPGTAVNRAVAADEPRVIYEDADLLVVDKPAGLLTSTVPGERRPTLLAAVRRHVAASDARARVGLIHRLDRDASGLLIFSKNDIAYRSLKTQFFHHAVEREYLAVVYGVPDPPAGRIESRLVERTDGTVHSTRQAGRGQRAVTEYEVLKSAGGRSLVRVNLHTGRKHQIRVQLSGRGTPIVGDTVYGRSAPDSPKPDRLLLAAVRLRVDHPRTGKPVMFEIDPPGGFRL